MKYVQSGCVLPQCGNRSLGTQTRLEWGRNQTPFRGWWTPSFLCCWRNQWQAGAIPRYASWNQTCIPRQLRRPPVLLPHPCGGWRGGRVRDDRKEMERGGREVGGWEMRKEMERGGRRITKEERKVIIRAPWTTSMVWCHLVHYHFLTPLYNRQKSHVHCQNPLDFDCTVYY